MAALAIALLKNSSSIVHHLRRLIPTFEKLPAAATFVTRRSFATQDSSYRRLLYQVGEAESAFKRNWVMKHYEKALRVRFQMPGITRDQVSIWMEKGDLAVKGISDSGECYVEHVPIQSDEFDLDNLKVTALDGVLEIILPRITPIDKPSGLRCSWDSRTFHDSLQIRIDMPGLTMDNVTIKKRDDSIFIKGTGVKECPEDEKDVVYFGSVLINPTIYNIDEIKTEMKCGVLKVFVPKFNVDKPKTEEDQSCACVPVAQEDDACQCKVNE